jgi:hypothetical protein
MDEYITVKVKCLDGHLFKVSNPYTAGIEFFEKLIQENNESSDYKSLGFFPNVVDIEARDNYNEACLKAIDALNKAYQESQH